MRLAQSKTSKVSATNYIGLARTKTNNSRQLFNASTKKADLLSELADELLFEVVKYLSPRDFERLSRVSWRFYNLLIGELKRGGSKPDLNKLINLLFKGMVVDSELKASLIKIYELEFRRKGVSFKDWQNNYRITIAAANKDVKKPVYSASFNPLDILDFISGSFYYAAYLYLTSKRNTETAKSALQRYKRGELELGLIEKLNYKHSIFLGKLSKRINQLDCKENDGLKVISGVTYGIMFYFTVISLGILATYSYIIDRPDNA
ncbi:MAG: F-box protein [Burkholderiales bacterium]